jgi:hypothetical protein
MTRAVTAATGIITFSRKKRRPSNPSKPSGIQQPSACCGDGTLSTGRPESSSPRRCFTMSSDAWGSESPETIQVRCACSGTGGRPALVSFTVARTTHRRGPPGLARTPKISFSCSGRSELESETASPIESIPVARVRGGRLERGHIGRRGDKASQGARGAEKAQRFNRCRGFMR